MYHVLLNDVGLVSSILISALKAKKIKKNKNKGTEGIFIDVNCK